MVDDVGRVGMCSQQHVEHVRVQPSPSGDRKARPDRVAGKLVTEMDVRRVDLEELPPLGFFSCSRPVRHHRVEQRRLDAAGHHRDEFHQTACIVVEARRPPEDGIGHRWATSPWTARQAVH